MTECRMNAEARRLWVDALRSDRYQQGTGALHTVGGYFCCLGVLCEVALEQGMQLRVAPVPHDTHRLSYEGEDSYLPDEVVAWAGLSFANPTVPQPVYPGGDLATPVTLADLNDVTGLSFAEIADLIEKHL